jgi:beta-phosphoglucomutase-like phosphatase (HAD superfamily)
MAAKLAEESLGKSVIGNRCLVVEDSYVGLQATKASGTRCIKTPSYYTIDDFSQADLVVNSVEELFDVVNNNDNNSHF